MSLLGHISGIWIYKSPCSQNIKSPPPGFSYRNFHVNPYLRLRVCIMPLSFFSPHPPPSFDSYNLTLFIYIALISMHRCPWCFTIYKLTAGAYEQEHATPLYFCHGVFIDRFIFRPTLNETHKTLLDVTALLDRNCLSLTKEKVY